MARSRPTVRSARLDARTVVDRLAVLYPDATTELDYANAFELLTSTILAAQSTDVRVNLIRPTLYARFPDARTLAAADPADVEPIIKSTGFFRAKARAIIGMAQALVERHDGQVPASMDALVALPGVGRKTANVVLGHALGVPGLPVDRHVLRVAQRIGLVRDDDPVVVERQLCRALPERDWVFASDCLILHGRRVCRPTPKCDRCPLTDGCAFYGGSRARPVAARAPAKRPAPRARPRR